MTMLLLVLSCMLQDDPTMRGLVDRLGADYMDERAAAREALAEAGVQAEPALLKGLESPDFRIRRDCLDLLAGLGSSAALPVAGKLFRTDDDASVRDAAFGFLRAAGKAAEGDLAAALESSERKHRLGALNALAALRSGGCAERVYGIYEKEEDPELKQAAFEYLASAGAPAVPFLVRLLGSPNPYVRRGALYALREQTPDAAALAAAGKLFAAETDIGVLDDLFSYLKASGAKAEPHFAAALGSAREAVRLKALEGLKVIPGEEPLEAAGALLDKDPSPAVRQAAASYLVSRGARSVPVLTAALASEREDVRLSALKALGDLRAEAPFDTVVRWFREGEGEVRRAAFLYLCRIGARAEREIVEALSDADRDIRLLAIRVLGNLKTESAAKALIALADDLDAGLRSEAIDALARIGAEEVVREAERSGRLSAASAQSILDARVRGEIERVLAACLTDDGGSGYYDGIFQGLEQLGREKVVPVLLRIVADDAYPWRLSGRDGAAAGPMLRTLAITALGEMGDASAVAPLKEVLKRLTDERSDDVVGELAVALCRLGDAEAYKAFAARVHGAAEGAFSKGSWAEGCILLFRLGLMQNRAGRRDESLATYRRLAEVAESHQVDPGIASPALYNLACLFSLNGDRKEAVEWLEKAVKAGFNDREWIKRDKDLDPIREEAGYKKLMDSAW